MHNTLSFENGGYIEKTGAGVELEDAAPPQALILRLLESKGP